MGGHQLERLGIYCIGARGAIGVAAQVGVRVLEEGEIRPGGMISQHPPFDRLPFLPWDRWVFGGCDLATTPLLDVLQSHLAAGVLPAADRPFVRTGLEEAEGRIDSVAGLAARVADPGDDGHPLTGNQVIEELRGLLRRFAAAHQVERTVVLSCCSTEPQTGAGEALREPESWEALHLALDGPAHQLPWGPLYATAALLEDCAFVNFTPNQGTELPGLADLARRRALPHAGRDGKTGETLLKSVLAPMFAERDLDVLTWQGYNLLGNNDGLSLSDPRALASKVASKDGLLRELLPGSRRLHTHVGIDYVPSLGDWKTAWDFIHFQGFLGARMSMQFVWSGCDTALAAPLVLELVRFTELAWRRGESGHLSHLDAYFKSPAGTRDHDFRRQTARLRDYAERFELREPADDETVAASPFEAVGGGRSDRRGR